MEQCFYKWVPVLVYFMHMHKDVQQPTGGVIHIPAIGFILFQSLKVIAGNALRHIGMSYQR